MKNLIVLFASLILLLTFPLQYALEQKNHHNISQLNKYIHNAKEQAKQKGYFTDEIINELKGNILIEFNDLVESEIIIDVTQTPKYRTSIFNENELIYYEIGIPIDKLVYSNIFWGITDSENKMIYTVKNYTTSELVIP